MNEFATGSNLIHGLRRFTLDNPQSFTRCAICVTLLYNVHYKPCEKSPYTSTQPKHCLHKESEIFYETMDHLPSVRTLVFEHVVSFFPIFFFSTKYAVNQVATNLNLSQIFLSNVIYIQQYWAVNYSYRECAALIFSSSLSVCIPISQFV